MKRKIINVIDTFKIFDRIEYVLKIQSLSEIAVGIDIIYPAPYPVLDLLPAVSEMSSDIYGAFNTHGNKCRL